MVARLLPERGRSFTSLGFSLCLLSILYTVLCDKCIVWGMCDTVALAAFIPMTCHRWLMVLFPVTKSNWTVTKSWLLGWPKLYWFQLYCSKTLWTILTHFYQTYYQVYTHHIDNFSGSHSMPNTMRNKFENFLQELFSRGVQPTLVLSCVLEKHG